jgi:hypothetical protein
MSMNIKIRSLLTALVIVAAFGAISGTASARTFLGETYCPSLGAYGVCTYGPYYTTSGRSVDAEFVATGAGVQKQAVTSGTNWAPLTTASVAYSYCHVNGNGGTYAQGYNYSATAHTYWIQAYIDVTYCPNGWQ